MIPKVHYARTSAGLVAYQVFGAGPLELVLCDGVGHQIEAAWDHPTSARFLEGLGAFARVLAYDPRGLGLSDPIPHKEQPTWEDGTEDVKAVIAAAGMQRPALVMSRQAGRAGMFFAATNPDHVAALVLMNTSAYVHREPGYEAGLAPDRRRALEHEFIEGWGTEAWIAQLNPALANDPAMLKWFARMMRASASPNRGIAAWHYSVQFDARPFLSAVRVPTLVLHSEQYPYATLPQARYLAEHIPGARLVVFPGYDTTPTLTRTDEVLGHIKAFLLGSDAPQESDCILATMLFIDVAGSSELTARLGDRRWKDLQQQFFAVVREELSRFAGREIDTAGDGFLAAFDGPGRAIRCALRVRSRGEDLALPLRFGVHTGECQRTGDKLTGLAVNIGARVCARAEPGEVLVSRTVRDLLIGSGVKLAERGTHQLKGIPGDWLLFAVA